MFIKLKFEFKFVLTKAFINSKFINHENRTMTPTMPQWCTQGYSRQSFYVKSSTSKLNDRTNGKPLWSWLKPNGILITNGYIVIKMSQRASSSNSRFFMEFEEKNPNDISTWYTPPRAEMQMKELANTGMVEVYNNQHLWNNRMTQKCTIFSLIYGEPINYG
jgi:hypothetical protein